MMNLEYQHLVPNSFADNAKVWIYQCNRMFSIGEALQLEEMLEGFTQNWQSHGSPVSGYANLFFGRFVVIIADETMNKVGGCSTDASQRFIKEVEANFGVNLFDRTNLAFVVKDKIEALPLTQLVYAIENGFITTDTLYFNNLVLTKKDFLTKWIVPVGESWLAPRIMQKAV